MLDLLNGLRIVDASSIVMGPMAGQAFADMGADVIKLEPPTGDLARTSGARGPDGMGALYANNNRNKRSLVLDLKTESGQKVLARLLDKTDVLLHNMRPNAALRVGLDAASVRANRARIIHCTATGFGSGGVYAGRPAYDDIIQAVGGLAGLTCHSGAAPAYVPSIMADKIGAMHVVQAVLAAVIQRSTTGQGTAVEVPMFECLAAFLMNEHLDAATFCDDGTPGYSRLLNPHRRPYKTADGWLAVMPYNEAHWRRTFEVLGEIEIPASDWFPNPAERNARSAQLYERLAQGLIDRSTQDWADIFERIDVPHSQVSSLGDLLKDPHLSAKGFFEPTDDMPGRKRSVPIPLTFDGIATRPDSAPPALGEHSREILGDLNYQPEDISALVTAGVVGTT